MGQCRSLPWHRNIQERAQWRPAITHMILEKIFGGHERSHLIIMRLHTHDAVVFKVIVVEDLLELGKHGPGPPVGHEEELGCIAKEPGDPASIHFHDRVFLGSVVIDIRRKGYVRYRVSIADVPEPVIGISMSENYLGFGVVLYELLRVVLTEYLYTAEHDEGVESSGGRKMFRRLNCEVNCVKSASSARPQPATECSACR